MTRERDLDLVDEDEALEEDELAELAVSDGSSGVLGFIGGLVLGTLIGAGIALLVAPERGEVTRRRIRDRMEDFQDDAKEQLGDLRDDATRALKRRHRQLKRRLKSRVD